PLTQRTFLRGKNGKTESAAVTESTQTASTDENQNQDSQDDAIPAETFERVGLNVAQEPFYSREGNGGGHDGSQNHQAPVFRSGAGRGGSVLDMMKRLENLESAGSQHRGDAD